MFSFFLITLVCLLPVVIGGLEEAVRLCKDCHDPMLLRALCKVIVAMVPDPDDLVVSKTDQWMYECMRSFIKGVASSIDMSVSALTSCAISYHLHLHFYFLPARA